MRTFKHHELVIVTEERKSNITGETFLKEGEIVIVTEKLDDENYDSVDVRGKTTRIITMRKKNLLSLTDAFPEIKTKHLKFIYDSIITEINKNKDA